MAPRAALAAPAFAAGAVASAATTAPCHCVYDHIGLGGTVDPGLGDREKYTILAAPGMEEAAKQVHSMHRAYWDSICASSICNTAHSLLSVLCAADG